MQHCTPLAGYSVTLGGEQCYASNKSTLTLLLMLY